MTKKELRAAMRRRNLGMDAAERAEASRRIFGRAGRLEAFGAARTVGVFCSLPDEPDTAETLARWSAVKRIVVPRVEGDVMRFCEYAGARCGRGRGYYDKYLSRPDVHAVKVGVCFAHQLVGELPAEPHDVAMDYIITD